MEVSHECITRSPLINQGYPPISLGKPLPKGEARGNPPSTTPGYWKG